jgi:hypothetical protein
LSSADQSAAQKHGNCQKSNIQGSRTTRVTHLKAKCKQKSDQNPEGGNQGQDKAKTPIAQAQANGTAKHKHPTKAAKWSGTPKSHGPLPFLSIFPSDQQSFANTLPQKTRKINLFWRIFKKIVNKLQNSLDKRQRIRYNSSRFMAANTVNFVCRYAALSFCKYFWRM